MGIRSLTRAGIASGVKRSNAWDAYTVPNNGIELIAQQIYTSNGGASAIVFSNIPQTYSHLYILSKFRDLDSSNTDISFTTITLNGASANSETNATFGIGTGTISTNKYQNSCYGTPIQRGNGPSGAYAVTLTDIPFYTVAGREKHFTWSCGVTGTSTYGFMGNAVVYNGTTNAITSIQIDPGNNGWAAGSMIQLYGVK
jgi:hypothetical protein